MRLWQNKDICDRMEKVRINKYLSEQGICSRRAADKMIEEGRILINSHIAQPGEKVSAADDIIVDGERLAAGTADEKVVLAYNKPVGVVCSMVDQSKANNSIADVIAYPKRVYPCGRLDKDSEGLILLTNDGELNDHIIRAGKGHEKEYEVIVDERITEEFLEKMSAGVDIVLKDERRYHTKACTVYPISEQSFGIVLTEGKNRQIRRMCESLGYTVMKLKRIRVMSIELGDLKIGSYRELKPQEIDSLRRL